MRANCNKLWMEIHFHSRKYRSWWRHQMETFSALLAICAGNSPVPGEFHTQRPVTRSFDVYFDLRPNKRLIKQWWGWWFETQSCPLWRHRNVKMASAQCRLCRPGFTMFSKQQEVGRSTTRCFLDILDIMILHTTIQWQEQSKIRFRNYKSSYGRAVGCLLWRFWGKLIPL